MSRQMPCPVFSFPIHCPPGPCSAVLRFAAPVPTTHAPFDTDPTASVPNLPEFA